MIAEKKPPNTQAGDTKKKKSVTVDEAVLASLGYKQEFKREFSRLEIFGIGFSIVGVVPSITATIVFAFPNGGPSAIIWGWLGCCFPLMCIAFSMAELASSAPTSGGLYYWTYKYSSPRYRRLLSWIIGFLLTTMYYAPFLREKTDANTISNFASVASIDWGLAVMIMAAASIGSDLTYVPTTAHTFGVFCAAIICHALMCSVGTAFIARLQKPFIVLNALLPFAIIIGVPAATPSEFKNTAHFAFEGFDNLLGWSNGFAFILSFLFPLWTIGAFDSTVHLSEEATNASVAVPWAIIYATGSGCVLGWGINLALMFCMGQDVGVILSSPIQQPMATILLQSFGKNGALAVWSFIIMSQFMMGANYLCAASRQTFAFSRDGALPFSHFLYHISPRFGTPIYCVWFTAGFATVLSSLAFAGLNAINAIFTLAVACQYVVYIIPISARYLGGMEFNKGPFNLGRFSLPTAIISVLWMAFNTVIFMFPASPGPTQGTMNYSCVVLGGTLLFSIIYFYFPKYGGIHWFDGPVRNVSDSDLDEGPTPEKLEYSDDGMEKGKR